MSRVAPEATGDRVRGSERSVLPCAARTAATTRNYERLARIKAEYDPDNFFRVNQNIEPAG